jgi:hypothetical protein
VAFVAGGSDGANGILASMERYDAASGVWQGAAPMAKPRHLFGL